MMPAPLSGLHETRLLTGSRPWLLVLLLLGLVLTGAPRKSPADSELAPRAEQPVLDLQLGHTGSYEEIAFSPDDRLVVTCSSDTTLKLWDRRTSTLVRTIRGHRGSVRSVAFSPDGTHLASSSDDGTARLWEVGTGRLLRTLEGHKGEDTRLAFSPDGKLLASGGNDGGVRLWNPDTGALLRKLEGHTDSVTGVTFSADGRLLASASLDQTVRLWEPRSGQLVRSLPHEARTYTVRFSPTGDLLAVGTEHALRIWDPQTGASLRSLETAGDRVTSVAFMPDGESVAGGMYYSDRIYFWNPRTGEPLRVLSGDNRAAWQVALSHDGKTLATSGLGGMLRDPQTGVVQGRLGRQDWMDSLAFSPDGRMLASGSQASRLRLWDLETGGLLRTLDGAHAAFSPDGRLLASGTAAGDVKLWNPQTGALQRTRGRHNGLITAIAFSADGRKVVTGGVDHWVRVWGVSDGQGQPLWEADTGAEVRAVGWSPDGAWVASGGLSARISLWDGAGRTVPTLECRDQVHTLSFTPDSRRLVACGHGGRQVWNTRNWVRDVAVDGVADGAAVSPDGESVCSWFSREWYLWSARTGQRENVGNSHDHSLAAVAFAPKGRRLATASLDGTVRLWDPATGALQLTLIALPPRSGETASSDWLTLTPHGYYDGSPGSGRFIRWQVGEDSFPVSAYEQGFRRPDLVRKTLLGETVPETPEVRRFSAGDAIPPQVVFLSPRAEALVAGEAVPVDLIVTDDRKPVRVEVTANGRRVVPKAIALPGKPIALVGKPMALASKPLARVGKTVPAAHRVAAEYHALVPLPPGETEVSLRAVVTDDEGLEGWEEIRLHRKLAAPTRGDLYVLAVGVSCYRSSRFNLQYASRDAEAFAGLWSPNQGGQYRKVVVTRCLDGQATLPRVREALTGLASRAGRQDTVVLFLSGHGLQLPNGRFYFATHEVDPSTPARLEATALPWTLLESTLARVQAKRVLLFLDACHSGGQLGERQATTERLAERLARRSGVLVFASSRGGQYSYELGERRHGAFTAALLEGLGEGRADLEIDGKRDGRITVEKLLTYLRARVPELTEGMQTPTCPLWTDFGEGFVLFRTP